jgi:bifunctional non-homologous end joining protein LigD
MVAKRSSDPDAPLGAYTAKRRRGVTPEPMPEPATKPPARTKGRGNAAPTFVIQEHHASALHWDFRLEHDGVLVSWALPKGVPFDPKRNHLAVHVEDHPLDYGAFEGNIPKGEYGGGTVTIWDRGTYESLKWRDREVMVDLHGDRVQGRYVLFPTSPGGRDWMIHRMDPSPSGWEGVPDLVRPMLAVAGQLPGNDEGWAYEFKWDGIRAVIYIDGGHVRILTRNDHDVSPQFPELRGLGRVFGARGVVLDGEIVALDDEGRPSFSALQPRIHAAEPSRSKRRADHAPITFFAFDVLHLDGRSTLGLAYAKRRQLLESLNLEGTGWATPPSFQGVAGVDVAQAAGERGLEGLVAKGLDSDYQPGRRPGSWIKVKRYLTQDVVIGGFTAGRGNRGGAIGALVLGVPGAGGLEFVGKVGTGFSEADLTALGKKLAPLRRVTSPFNAPIPPAQVDQPTWVRPVLVGEVQFTGWTTAGRLRQASWRGLRPELAPADVVREN